MTRPFRLSPLAALALAACVSPAVSGGIEGTEWHLIGIEGMPVSFRATLQIEGDRASGQAPCNRWFATNGAPCPPSPLAPSARPKWPAPTCPQRRPISTRSPPCSGPSWIKAASS